MTLKNLVLLFILSSHLCCALLAHKRDKDNNAQNLIVKTWNGKVRGTSYYIDANLNLVNKESPLVNSRVNAWLGIPFAEKPLGNFRFKRAKRVRSWRPNVLNTTQLPNTCFQLRDTLIPNFEGVEMWNPNTPVSEDCLYLNIWTPGSNRKGASHKKIPVLVCVIYTLDIIGKLFYF
jgi:acetylcholinesterase